jgi:SAM-dependent methyltransferase
MNLPGHPVARARRVRRRALQALRPPPADVEGRRPTLTELGLHFEVVKARPRDWNGKALTDHYEPFLQGVRDEPIRLLELGVKHGASLRMWKAYFPAATIVGVDLDEAATWAGEPRIEIVIGDQSDPATVRRALDVAGGPFDVICDDGGHHARDQLGALELLWSHLVPGGVYLIDDVHTSYRESYGMGRGQAGTTIEYLKAAIDDIHVREHGQDVSLPGLEEAHFYFHLVVLRKLRARDAG